LHEISTPTAEIEAVSPEAIERATAELRDHLPASPLQYSRALTAKAGCHVYLKIETIHPTRAFKVRGALNKLAHMRPEERASGVVTASAGNHGQGVAYAAQVFQVPATVYVPDNANRFKVQAIKRMGSRVVHAGRTYAEAYAEAMHARETSGATFVHAFDDPDVIVGQGTIAVELLEQLPTLDTVLVPVGGGGLISGIAAYLKARRPTARVVGVEPAGADAMTRSLAAGRPVTLDRVDTMADGLAADAPGDLTFQIVRAHVDRMITVEETELLRAIRLFFEWEHLLAEPAGAAALAALLHHYTPEPDEQVVVILSGANLTEELMLQALRTR
jgi:threonine dehydratase